MRSDKRGGYLPSPAHHVEKFMVVFGRSHVFQHEFHGLDFVHVVHQLTQDTRFLKNFRGQQQFFLARSAAVEVNRRNTRFSYRRRSRWISQLPVPLNSSKITSSMRLPVSISAVPMMVRLPPSSILRAAPKKRLGRCSALASTPPLSTLPEEGSTLL